MCILRNFFMFLLLTLSSFGNVVCVEPSGNECSSPLLIDLIHLVAVPTTDQCNNNVCPCDCEPDDCQGALVTHQCGPLAFIQIPEEPAGRDLLSSPQWDRAILNHLHPLFHFNNGIRSWEANPPDQWPQGNISVSISTTVLRV